MKTLTRMEEHENLILFGYATATEEETKDESRFEPKFNFYVEYRQNRQLSCSLCIQLNK